MRLAISSPDGMGDFVLRIPFVCGLLALGHDIALWMREPGASLAEDVFPTVRVERITDDPYESRKPDFRRECAAVEAFRPDILVLSALQWSLFDEALLVRLGGRIAIAGMTAPRQTSLTRRCPARLSKRLRFAVPVEMMSLEFVKNATLAGAVVPGSWDAASRVDPSEASFEAAGERLKRLGVSDYVVTCVGARRGLKNKDWGSEKWAAFFREVATSLPSTILFLGDEREAASIDEIIAGSSLGKRGVNLAAEPPSVGESYALVARSGGYIGRDSGVMHLAALAGKPLVAVFGGWNWGRFLPRAETSVLFASLGGFNNDTARSVRDVPLTDVVRAFEQMVRHRAGAWVVELRWEDSADARGGGRALRPLSMESIILLWKRVIGK